MKKTFRLQPHEAGYLRLMSSAFAGVDYATTRGIEGVDDESAKEVLKIIREVQIRALDGLTSEYIRAALISKHVLKDGDQVHCLFDPSDENTENVCQVISQTDYEKNTNVAQ